METYNYSIYKIACKDSSVIDIYIGSSKNIKRRTHEHKSDCHNELRPKYNYKIYQTIRANGGWANYQLIIIEELHNVTKTQAEIREEHWRVELGASLNEKKAHRTLEQLKEYDKQYQKEYRENNKPQISERNKKYQEKNKEQLKQYDKHYREHNSEKITERIKQYREKNKDEINKRKREAYALKKSLVVTHPPLDEKI